VLAFWLISEPMGTTCHSFNPSTNLCGARLWRYFTEHPAEPVFPNLHEVFTAIQRRTKCQFTVGHSYSASRYLLAQPHKATGWIFVGLHTR